MKKIVIMLIIIFTAPLIMAEEMSETSKIYTVGIDAFTQNGKPPYKDIYGSLISGTVVDTVKSQRFTDEIRVDVVNGYGDGRSITYRDGVKKLETELSKGKLHGNETIYFKSGGVSSVTPYVNNQPYGLYTAYNEDGSLKRQVWYNGKDILACYSYENGKPVPESQMIMHICDSYIQKDYILNYDAFFDNETQLYVDKTMKAITGKIFEREPRRVVEMDVVNGILEGTVITINNGILKRKTNYQEGRKHGNDIIYHKNGRPEISVQFLYDRIDGLTTVWNENGSVIHEVIFRNGKAVSGYMNFSGKPISMTKDDFKEMEEMYLSFK